MAEGTATLNTAAPVGTPSGTSLHPWAWWWWALCIAGAVSLSTNPLFLLLTALTLTTVILLRRSDAPWARSVAAYFALAGFILALRVVFQIVLGAQSGTTVWFTLPEIDLPDWAAGIRLGGAVTVEALAYTIYDGLRLGVMLLSLGAANTLANPKRALRSVPAALYEASVAVVIALSVAPQLVESVQRVRRARRLRGGRAAGWGAVRAVVIPVLEDAVDRSMTLAAGMEARGFGRTKGEAQRSWLLDVALIAAMMLVTFGGFLLLGSEARGLGLACVGTGASATVAGLRASGRRLRVTRYRPDPWGGREWVVCLSGTGVVALTVVLAAVPGNPLNPATHPLAWPDIHPLMSLAFGLMLLPLAVTRPLAARGPAATDPPATDPAAAVRTAPSRSAS